MTEPVTAVVDRVEDGTAALELDDGQRRELLVDADRLPDPARRADAVLEVTVDGDTVLAASYDPEATRRRARRARERFDRLAERPDDEE